jgi:AraC-like DNA-binding protein
MQGGEAGPALLPVGRAELVTKDMDAIAGMIGRLYVQHRARFRFADRATVQAGNRSAIAGPLMAGFVHWEGVEYQAADANSDGYLLGVVAVRGGGVLTTAREQLPLTRGDVFLAPPYLPYAADLRDCAFAALRIPWSAAREVAEENTGLPSASLHFESMAPVSESVAAVWERTVMFGCRQLLESDDSEISSLVTQELTRLAAAALLETFPNTTMTAPYLRGPGWVPPVTVRRAAAFIEARAGEPVTLADIAEQAGVTGRALQYAFRRHYGTTPTGYLRRVRLERAHHELYAADPATGATVAAIARRWGWANPAQFASAYRQRFGQPPGQTLRA